jgi:hypothetical protein
MPLSTMGGKKRNQQQDTSSKKPAASPRRGQKNKQSKTNSGANVVRNKPLPASPAITQKTKAASTKNVVAVTTTTPSKNRFTEPSDSRRWQQWKKKHEDQD